MIRPWRGRRAEDAYVIAAVDANERSAQVVKLLRLQRGRERPSHELDAEVDDRGSTQGLGHQGGAGNDGVHALGPRPRMSRSERLFAVPGTEPWGGPRDKDERVPRGFALSPTDDGGSTVDVSRGFPVFAAFAATSGRPKPPKCEPPQGRIAIRIRQRKEWRVVVVRRC